MDELEIIDTKNINKLIYTIRGKQVMLDSDLAKLYGYSQGVKALNQTVKRNTARFPKSFYFQLTKNEYYEILKSQSVTLELKQGQYSKFLPHVFTEEGVAMLSSVLRTKNAAQISVNIMQAFVAMRHFITENKDIYQSLNNINNKLIEHDLKLEEVFSYFEKESKELLYLNDEIYDAYSKLIDIMSKAKNELIIIDNYADKNVLDMISKININVVLIIKTKPLLSKTDIKKYNEQYHNLTVINNDSFHDRYLILDKKEVYHCGASLNYAGTKTFSINKLKDEIIIKLLITNVNRIIK